MKRLSRRGLLGLALTASSARPTTGSAGLLAEVLASIARRAPGSRRAVTGVPTGIAGVDTMTGGLQPGHLTIVAAAPGIGKTAWATSAALHAALRHRVPVLFFSLATAREELMERMLASEARVEAARMRRSTL